MNAFSDFIMEPSATYKKARSLKPSRPQDSPTPRSAQDSKRAAAEPATSYAGDSLMVPGQASRAGRKSSSTQQPRAATVFKKSLLPDSDMSMATHSKPEAESVSEMPPLPNELSAEREEACESTLNISQTPIPVVDDQPALLIGLSGITSSGKKTLAHFLSQIFPSDTPVFILHQDSFLVPKHLLVPSSNGELDAHCHDAFDHTALKRVLEYAKREGKVPPALQTVQAESDERTRAISLVSQDEIDELKALVIRSELFQTGRPIGIVVGFLLYHDPTIRSLLDVKLVLRSSKGKVRQRHFERPEYMSEAGDFWLTRDYFDSIVWRNYSQEYGPLFENGNVEGRPIKGVSEALRIVIQPRLDQSIPENFKWAVESILKDVDDQKISEDRALTLEMEKYEICDCTDGWLGLVRQAIFNFI